MTGTETTTTPQERLRDAAADALEWLRWMQAGPLIRDFGQRRGLGDEAIMAGDAALERAIAALEAALEEQP